MQQHLDSTIAIWRGAQFAWGSHDCILATCDHIARVTGVDPAAPWRGTYDTEAGAQAIFDAYGGVLALFEYGMQAAGFVAGQRVIGAPVVAKIGDHEVCGIDRGSMVAFLAPDRGLTELRIPVLAAWPL